MRRILFLVVIGCSMFASGQQIYSLQNASRSEDRMQKQVMKWNEFNPDGENGVWSLEEMDTFGIVTARQVVFKDSATLMMPSESFYYRQTDRGIDLIGTENSMMQMEYDLPEQWLKFPMQRGDSVCGYFNGVGKYCNRLFVRRFGNYITKADMAGKLVLTRGDTLLNTLRLHTERYVSIITTPIDTMQRVIPTFTVDSIALHQANDSVVIREDCYRWYVEGYRYPVLEASLSRLHGQTLSSTLYYFPPEEQEQLALDDENRTARARLAAISDGNSGATDWEKNNSSGSGTIRYAIEQSDENHLISINYSLPHSAKVEAVLANSQGYVFKTISQTAEANIPQTLSLTYDGLHRGQYILYICVDSVRYTEKVNLR